MTTLRTSPVTLILKFLSDRPHSIADAIGSACRLTPGEVRARLAHLESLRLVTSRQCARTLAPSRIYTITNEGRRRVEG